MSIIDCPKCGGITNSIAPTCIHCYCIIKPVESNPAKVIIKQDKNDVGRAERIKRIKETVDVVFLRIVVLSFSSFLALQSTVYIFKEASEYAIKVSADRREQELLAVNEKERQEASVKQYRIAALQALIDDHQAIGLSFMKSQEMLGVEESSASIREIQQMEKKEVARIQTQINNVRNGIINEDIQEDINRGLILQQSSH